MTSNIWLTLEWVDDALTWNTSEYGGIMVSKKCTAFELGLYNQSLITIVATIAGYPHPPYQDVEA